MNYIGFHKSPVKLYNNLQDSMLKTISIYKKLYYIKTKLTFNQLLKIRTMMEEIGLHFLFEFSYSFGITNLF